MQVGLERHRTLKSRTSWTEILNNGYKIKKEKYLQMKELAALKSQPLTRRERRRPT